MLVTELTVKNLDSDSSDAFHFTTGLHTYFRVQDIHTTRVLDLPKGGGAELFFLDNTRGRQQFKEENRELSFESEFDRIYLNTSNTVRVARGEGKGTLVLEKSFKDTTVWNPWAENSKSIADLGDDEWKEFVCVEAVHFQPAVSLGKGEVWKAGQRIFLE